MVVLSPKMSKTTHNVKIVKFPFKHTDCQICRKSKFDFVLFVRNTAQIKNDGKI